MAYNNFFPAGYYQPQYQTPYQQNNFQPQQPQQNQGVVWVQGIEGAKAHPVAPGQSVLLMDSETNSMYLKSADASGMPSLRVFDYTERINTPQKSKNDDLSEFMTKDDLSSYVTKQDLEREIFDLKEEITNLSASLKKKGAKSE